MPTAEEYAAHLALLREVSSARSGLLTAWRASTLTRVEVSAWVALFRCGVLRTVDAQPWNYVALTAYGKVYWAERCVSSCAVIC